MKYLVVLVVVLGFACGSEEEDLGLQGLVDVEDDFDEIQEEGRQTIITDPALIIGNIIGALGNLNLTNPNSIVQDILDALTGGGTVATAGGLGAGLAGLTGIKGLAGLTGIKGAGLAGLVGVKSLIDIILVGIISLISGPLGLVNMVLSLVGLVILIIFLIDGGDFGSLLGVGRSLALPSSWIPDFASVDRVNNVVVDTVSDMVFKAIAKYEVLNDMSALI